MTKFRMPAEWETHDATWVAWPHEESDWPEKFATVPWTYAEIVRLLAEHERVEIICNSEQEREAAHHCLRMHHVPESSVRLHVFSTDRSWLRDSAPTCVIDDHGRAQWMGWKFNAWAKYDNFSSDAELPKQIASLSGLAIASATRPDTRLPLVLEGGAIDSDGEGSLLVTEECLLSSIQERNPGLDRAGYEQAFNQWLGVEKTIWLDRGVEGDDTHGHIDDIARFVAPGRVVLVFPDAPDHPYYQAAVENLRRLEAATDARGRRIEVLKLPMPRHIAFGEEVLPASYANFYVTNGAVLVPTFNDPNDFRALEVLKNVFPERQVVGLGAIDLILGQGSLHCLTQPQFAGR